MAGNAGAPFGFRSCTHWVRVARMAVVIALGLRRARRVRSGAIALPCLMREWQLPQLLVFATSKKNAWPRAAWAGGPMSPAMALPDKKRTMPSRIIFRLRCVREQCAFHRGIGVESAACGWMVSDMAQSA